MLDKTDIMDAHYDGHRAGQRRRILDVQQVGAVLPQPHRQFQSKAEEGIRRDLPGMEAVGDPLSGILGREICYEFRLIIQSREAFEEASNINLVSREVAADGVSINCETHQN